MLYKRDKWGNVGKVAYSGVWFIVDNKNVSWLCTLPPIKDATTYKDVQFLA